MTIVLFISRFPVDKKPKEEGSSKDDCVPLGMEDKTIKDTQLLSARSFPCCPPSGARLNGDNSWQPVWYVTRSNTVCTEILYNWL